MTRLVVVARARVCRFRELRKAGSGAWQNAVPPRHHPQADLAMQLFHLMFLGAHCFVQQL
jgi:hypothetical protein